MQPNFTLKKFGYSGFKAIALTLVLALFAQVSFSQEKQRHTPKPTQQQQAARERAKLQRAAGVYPAVNPKADNDAGLASRPRTNTQRIEAVCATFTGALGTGDLTMPSRLNRGGAQAGNCTTPYVPASPFGNAAYYYDVHTYTNTTGLTQCGTFTLTTTDLTNANIEFGVWNGSFDPNSLATNHMADPGVSTGTPANTLSIQVTINAGQTIVIPVWSANPNSAASGTASDYTVTVDFPLCSSSACTGTPTPGNTLSTAATACAGTNFTLSLQNATAGAGVTYQWQSSPDGTTWTNIPGATNPTLVRNHTATTYYQCNVTCSGNTGTSTPVMVALTPANACYCIPGASDCTDDDVITRVVFSTLDNASACSVGPPAGYSNYTTTVAAPNVFSGAANPIRVEVPTTWTEQVAVWIDYNQNGQFESSEYTNLGSNVGNAGILNGNIAIPSTALPGTTRMRVRVRFATAWTSTSPCTTAVFGETEDYNVNIVPCVPVTITSAPASVSTVCGGNATFTVGAAGSIPAYSWQYRVNSSGIWQTVTNGGVFSGATTATLTMTGVSQTYSGYQVRALVSGGCSAVDFSAAATLTVNPIVATVSPTAATICTGTIQQLTLTNASAPATVTFTNNTPLAIPDATPAGVFSTINVSGLPVGAVVTNVSVKLNIPDHTWVGDLEINLIAPNGANMNLIGELDNGTGSNGSDGFVNTIISSTSTNPISGAPAPRTGTYAAERRLGYGPSGAPQTVSNIPWTALTGTMNGNWVLGLSDWFNGDNGTLTDWSISITYGAAATGVWTASPNTTNSMFTDAAATVPYVAGSQATTIYVQPTVNTNYSVVYSTATPCTSNPTVIPVNVSNPVGGLTVSPATRAVCLGGSTTFTAAATSGNPLAYQWQRSTDGGLTYANIAGATSSTLTVSNVTSTMTGYRYRVVATASPCGSVTSTTFGTLTVNALPVATLTSPVVDLVPGATTTLTAASTPAAAANGWSWTFNGAALAGSSNTQTVGINGVGVYQATVTDINGCVSSTNELTIGSAPSDKLWIYPNPTTGAFQVRLYYDGSLAEKRIVTIYNAIGQIVTSRQFSLSTGTAPYMQMDFDLGGVISKGTYVVKVANQFTGKVVSGLVVVQ